MKNLRNLSVTLQSHLQRLRNEKPVSYFLSGDCGTFGECNEMSEPNFILIDDTTTLSELENFASSFRERRFPKEVCWEGGGAKPDQTFYVSAVELSHISEITLSHFVELLNLLQRIQNFDSFKSPFYCTVLSNDLKKFFMVRGPCSQNENSYVIYFLLKFYEHKDAFHDIYRFDIQKDEFGTQRLSKWKKKFDLFFKEKLVDFSHLDDGEKMFQAVISNKKSKQYKDAIIPLKLVYQEISDVFLSLTQKYNETTHSNSSTTEHRYQKGLDLEKQCQEILQKNGWKVKETPRSNDQGADLIAQKGVLKFIIQCKNYEKPVGNDAIQQVFAAKTFFEGNIAGVVSVSGYTNSAKMLAKKTEVILMNLEDIAKI